MRRDPVAPAKSPVPPMMVWMSPRSPSPTVRKHGDDLRHIPCFCGCNRFGHRNNRDCYIKSVEAGGAITFTSHAST
jgi:hypothetical protein